MAELADRYGANRLPALTGELLARSEQLVRRAVERLPDGRYSYVDWLDNDGVALDDPVRVEVAAEIAGDRVVIDFEGTSPQVRGPFNCVPSGAYAGAYFAVLAMSDPSIPINGGCFRPIELRLPEGSLVNPREPAPVNSRTSTIKRIAGTIIGALRQARPEGAPADAAAALHVLAFGGAREDGSRYVVGELIASGSGASRGRDGVDVIETDGSNCMNLPVEALEMDAPIRVRRSELRPDSGGRGAFRGGLGIRREYEVLAGEVVFTHRGERHRHPARGAAGGGPGGLRALGHPARGGRGGGGHPVEDPWSGSRPGTGWRSTPRAGAATATRPPGPPTSCPPISRAARSAGRRAGAPGRECRRQRGPRRQGRWRRGPQRRTTERGLNVPVPAPVAGLGPGARWPRPPAGSRRIAAALDCPGLPRSEDLRGADRGPAYQGMRTVRPMRCSGAALPVSRRPASRASVPPSSPMRAVRP